MTTVFLHPVGLDGASFQFLTAPPLESAVRYDCLWHGGRPKPPSPLSLESMADDVASNTSGPLDLIGVSMGGHVAQHLAFRYPHRVRSLMITSRAYPTAGELANRPPPTIGERARMVTEIGVEAMIEWTLPRWFTPTALSDLHHPGVSYVRDRLMTDTTEQLAAAWFALESRRTSFEQQVAGLTMPTTVVHATEDHVPVSEHRRLVEGLPSARLVVCDGPHMIHLEEPRLFERAVLEHLDWTEATLNNK